ncbi:SusC/RagA family TonB-linked outer membrane protein [Sphingobacterium thalpophilum]|uniref:Outer membrane cobalamin receptor protein n=1 Tax=Sphingobacterium thalpophilum TaxID=259 RepID=A0A4U9VGV2_9SPHI|nr:TonB-dependent receptor [Sphingobacterium thalpophilum]VTR44619.1 Outer membrane cobalamin receptor protein [Sphingobacterium thalpophilum]
MKQHVLTTLCLLACSSLQSLHAQQIQIAGKIVDGNGNPVSGVTVNIKGSSQGTSTNERGLFTLHASPEATLSISAVGYQTQEVQVNGRKTISITLVGGEQALDEVMVVAYGTAKKSTYTGSAATVKAKDIDDVPTTSFESALSGRVAGLTVSSPSGQAGSTPSIRIRGIGSMNASNEPLYVIDGVPANSGSGGQMADYIYTSNNVMGNLNPDDIETITVLKDAAASSLYGSRAANGVILITTKKGKTGKPAVNFKSSIGFTPTWATDNYETASPQDQVNMLYQIFHDYRTSNVNKETGVNYTDAEASVYALGQLNNRFNKHGYRFEVNDPLRMSNVHILGMTDGIENREGRYYDWDKALFRTGIYQDNNLSLSGGTEATKYFSSLGYTTDKSRIRVNDFERISGRLNLTQKIVDNLEFGANINIGHNKKKGFNDTRNTGTNYFMQSRNLLWPLYWPTNYKTGEAWTDRYGSYAYNADYYDQQWDNSSKTNKLGVISNLTWTILPELTAKTVFSYDYTDMKDYLYYSAKHFNGISDGGVVHQFNTNMLKLVSSNTVNYNKSFDKHNLNLLAGFEAEKNKTDFMRTTGRGLGSAELPYISSAGKFEANAYSWGYNLMSFLGRAEYNYDNTYFLAASYRRDGSSKLGPKNRWGDFWSVSGAYSLKSLPALRENEAISTLRLKASYGVNGTLPTDNFGWRRLVSFNNFNYKGQPGGNLISNPDPDITWETSYTTNAGLEFGFLNNRITGSVEYFNRTSKNLLQDVPTSQTTGFSTVLRNVGQINNKGLEIELAGDIIKKEDFRWSANVNAAFVNSKVQKLNDHQDIIWYDPTGSVGNDTKGSGDARAQFIYREGQSTLAFYGYEWAGVDHTNGKNVYYTNNEQSGEGIFEYNGRKATYDFNQADYTIIGNGVPKVSGGINTDFAYKNFSLGFNFVYKIGGKLYDGAFKDVADDGYYWERIRSAYAFEHMWTENNTSGTLPKLDGNDLTDPQKYSSRQLHDATFLRLKNINFGYRLPKTFLHTIGFSSARVYFNGTNLWTASKYKIADPEVGQYSTRGWETPIGKTYTFGIELGF